jgi:ABC-2 type transport system ATP-binding protein
MTQAFALSGLRKSYAGFTLGPLDLAVDVGSVVGFVGPNGSGKTTTLRCLSGQIRPQEGRVEILGRPADAEAVDWRHDVAFVSDEPAFFEEWTGRRNLEFVGRYFDSWSSARADELAERFACPLEQKVKTLSKGNRVKLALVMALSRDARLLLLDEPTAGLDPVVRSEVLDVLWELLESGQHTIFYSTHNLSDIDRLADELVFLRDGQIGERAPKDSLMERWGQISFQLAGDVPTMAEVVQARNDGEQHQLVSRDVQATLARLSDAGAHQVQHSPLPIDEIAVHILKGANHVAHR